MNLNQIYSGLQDSFIRIRHYVSVGSYNQKLFEDTINQIKDYQKFIVDNQFCSECPILLYCIETLFEIIDENNKEKLYHFADTIHNMPEIYLKRRSIESFSLEIETFCDMYGNSYFKCF